MCLCLLTDWQLQLEAAVEKQHKVHSDKQRSQLKVSGGQKQCALPPPSPTSLSFSLPPPSLTHMHTPIILYFPCHFLIQNKRAAFKSCRDLEAGWDQLEDGRGTKTDKDIHKMEKTCRKLEESLIKVDREYRDSNIKTEESRLAWESAMYRCCRVKNKNNNYVILSTNALKVLNISGQVDIHSQITF